eukprot:scaffold167_cov244-Pinguiococcus_pyrenoidosus.AAC.1
MRFVDRSELAVRILQELRGRAVLENVAVAQHENAIVVHDGVDAVRDGQDRGIGKLLAQGPLNETVRSGVDGAGGLVKKQQLAPADEGAREAKHLALAEGEIAPAFFYLGEQLPGQDPHHGILRNDADAAAHVVQAETAQLHAVEADATSVGFHEPKDGDEEGRLPRPRSSADAHALPRLNGHVQAFQHQRQARAVAQLQS